MPGESTELVKLIHDFRCTRPEDMEVPELADQVHYYKKTEGGIVGMCRIMEDFAEEIADKKTLSLIKNLMESLKLSADQVMDAMKLSADDRKRLSAKL